MPVYRIQHGTTYRHEAPAASAWQTLHPRRQRRRHRRQHPLDDVLRLRRGVCQDFAHLCLACVRRLGLAGLALLGLAAVRRRNLR